MTKTQQPELPALPSDKVLCALIRDLKQYGAGFDDGPGMFGEAAHLLAQQAKRIATLESAQAAVLADRESRKVVAWPYMPSPTWGEYVITQDPKVAEVARSMGVEVEELTVGATSKVEDSHG